MDSEKKAFDLYYSNSGSIDQLKTEVEKMLSIELLGRSSDWLGEYYKTSIDYEWSVKLRENVDYDGPDTFAHEDKFSMDTILLYVDNVSPKKAKDYREIILNSGLFMLGRDEFI
jgi:hypothetical protein